MTHTMPPSVAITASPSHLLHLPRFNRSPSGPFVSAAACNFSLFYHTRKAAFGGGSIGAILCTAGQLSINSPDW